MNCGRLHKILEGICAAMLVLAPGSAYAQQVRISKLTDVAFGTIGNFTTDLINAQNVCLFNNKGLNTYNITATGNGASGAFTLSAGSNKLAYEVQWSASSGQTTGTALMAGVTLTNLTDTATISDCSSGPATTASLITILRTAQIGAATAGFYSGTLTLLVAAN